MKRAWLSLIILLVLCGIQSAQTQSQAPGPNPSFYWEFTCPIGMAAVASHQTYNSTTGKFRMTECVDGTGNIYLFDSNTSLYRLVGVPSVSGAITTGDCVKWASVTSIGDLASPCAGTTLANAFSGNNTHSGTETFTLINGLPLSTGYAGANVSARVTAADTASTGNLLIPPSETSGAIPSSLASGHGLLDLRGTNSGNGGFFYARQLATGDTTGASFFVFNTPDGVNGRALLGDASNIIGTSTGTNINGVQGLVNSSGSAAVGGTNYGGVDITYAGTVSCTGTACTGTSTNFGAGTPPNMAAGDYVGISGVRPILCEQIVASVTSATAFVLGAAFQAACGTISGSTLVRLIGAEGTHGDGITIGLGGTVGPTSGTATGNVNRPQLGVRGMASPFVNFAVGVQGINQSPAGSGFAGQFCRNNPCLSEAANKATVDIRDSLTAGNASGNEILRIGALGNSATPGSGPCITFDNAQNPSTVIAKICAAFTASNNINLSSQNYSGGLLASLNITQTVASGTAAMTTAAIAAGACGTTVTVAAAGVLTTDTITVSFNAAPAGTNAGLVEWPTAGNVNFAYCPGVAETPAAATINWQVVR